MSWSVLAGALAVNAATGALTTNATAPAGSSATTISATVLADNGTDGVAKHISVPVSAVSAVYLPTITAARTGVWSPTKLLSGYSGPTMQLTRSSDGATLDIYPYSGGQAPDLSGLSAWAGASTVTCTKLYDQTGNGYHLTPYGGDAAPILSTSNAVRGKQPLSFVGGPNSLGNSAIPFTDGSFAELGVYAPKAAGYGRQGNTLWSVGATAYAGGYHLIHAGYAASNGNGVFSGVGGSQGLAPHYARNSQFQVISYSPRADAATAFRMDGTPKETYFGGGSASDTGLRIGRYLDTGGGTSYANFFDFLGHVHYAASLSDADYAAERAALTTIFDLFAQSDGTAWPNIVFDGDSRTLGLKASLNQNLSFQVQPLLSKRALMSNVGVSGATVAGLNTANGRANIANTYRSGRTNVLVLTAGINDLLQGAGYADAFGQAGTAYSTGMHTTIYTNLVSLITYAKGLGYQVVVGTVLGCANAGQYADNVAGRQAQVAAYNSDITGGATTNGYTVVDYAAITALQDTTNTTNWATDQLHEVNAGYALEAQALATVLNTKI